MKNFAYLAIILQFVWTGCSLAFEPSDVQIEILKNELTAEQSSDLLITLHRAQGKTDKYPYQRIATAMRLGRDGKPKAIKTFNGRLAFDLKRQPNGKITYIAEDGPLKDCQGYNSVVIGTDENLNPIEWHRTRELKHTNKHDFDILKNGNYLFNSYEPKRSSRGANFSRLNNCVQDAVVQEVRPNGKIEFEWHALEHFGTNPPKFDRKLVDYAHLNSTDLSDDNQLFLFSLRKLSQVAIVSRDTADVVGVLGDRGTFKFVNDPLNGFCGQHQVDWIGANRIILFDNGTATHCGTAAVPREYSRVVEYEIDIAAMTATLVWSYERKDVLSVSAGGAVRLKNGNTLIAWGRHGKAEPTAPSFTEVNGAGRCFMGSTR